MAAFTATNLDDIVVLLLFFSQVIGYLHLDLYTLENRGLTVLSAAIISFFLMTEARDALGDRT